MNMVRYFLLANLPRLTAEPLPEGKILSFDKAMIINTLIYIFNIAVLVFFLAKFLYKPVKKMLTERTERIQGSIDSANNELAEANTLKEEYEQKLAQIDKEREEVLALAHKRADERADHILKEARVEADNILARGLADLKLERQNELDNLKRQMIELSMLTAGRFVEVSINREIQDKYIDEALSDWEEGLWLD